MQFDLESLDDTPRELVIGERRFKCSQLRLKHRAKIGRIIKDSRPQPLKIAMERLAAVPPGSISDAAQEALLTKAYEDQMETEFVSETDVWEFMGTTDGALVSLLVCVQDHHPEVTPEHFQQLLPTLQESQLDAFFKTLHDVLGLPDRPTLPATEKAPKPGRKSSSTTRESSSSSRKRRLASRSKGSSTSRTRS